MSQRWSATDLIAHVLDPESFEAWDEPADYTQFTTHYRDQLEHTRQATNLDESILTGLGRIRGRSVAVVINDFSFLGGSIGQIAADRIIATVRRATAEGLPVLASTSSGGTRMQEGSRAFAQMAEITRAVMRHRQAGLPYLVHLRHPTTGVSTPLGAPWVR